MRLIQKLMTYCLLELIICIVKAGGAPDSILEQAALGPRDTLAFTGSVGSGAFSQGGGQQGRPLLVTTLKDNYEGGSLRWALSQPYPRTITFAVGGTISLNNDLIIVEPCVTVDASTVPGGITITNGTIRIFNVYDVILRYIRVRPGYELALHGNTNKTSGKDREALSIQQSAFIMIDHCSLSWSVGTALTVSNSSFITIQRSIIAEPLSNFRPSYYATPLIRSNSFEVSLVENLLSFFPDVGIELFSPGNKMVRASMVNNYICRYGSVAIQFALGSAPAEYHLYDNLFAYPEKTDSVAVAVVPIDPSLAEDTREVRDVKMYLSENRFPTVSNDSFQNDWYFVRTNFNPEILEAIKSGNQLFRTHFIDPFSALLVPEHVLSQVGASLPARDLIDRRIIKAISEHR